MIAPFWHCWPVKAAGTAVKKAAGALAWGRRARHAHRVRHYRRVRRVGKAAGAATARMSARGALTWVCVAVPLVGGGIGGGMLGWGRFGPAPAPVERPGITGRGFGITGGIAGGTAPLAPFPPGVGEIEVPPEFTAPQQFAALIPPQIPAAPNLVPEFGGIPQTPPKSPRPVPEPGSLALPLPALAALIAWRLK